MGLLTELPLKREKEKKKIIYFFLTLGLIFIIATKFYEEFFGLLDLFYLQSYNDLMTFITSYQIITITLIMGGVFLVFYRVPEFFVDIRVLRRIRKVRNWIEENLDKEGVESLGQALIESDKKTTVHKFLTKYRVAKFEEKEIKAGRNYYVILDKIKEIKDADKGQEAIDVIVVFYPIPIVLMLLLLFNIQSAPALDLSLSAYILVNSILVIILVIQYYAYLLAMFVKIHCEFIYELLIDLFGDTRKHSQKKLNPNSSS